MDDEILKTLTDRELKKIILNEAKNILSQRKLTESEKDGILQKNKSFESFFNIENTEKSEGKSEYNERKPTTHEKNEYLENKNKNFFNLQDFSLKYSETCKINNLNYENIEYELIISFINTFNNELKYQLKLNNINKQEDKENNIIHKMVKIFMDKLIFYCTHPIIFLSQNNNNNSLFEKEIISHIENFFKQLEETNDKDILFKNCLNEILKNIFNFKPNLNWISRQAFVDLIKIIIEENIKRNELCVICTTDLIKKNFKNLDFFQVDNVVVLIEIVQYAIIFLVEKKYSMKNFSLKNEKWFEHFGDLLQLLKNSEWKIFLNQLIAIETFLYDKKRENIKKSFNELYKHKIEFASTKNSSYSRWFKIEMPLSINLFK
ncbi:conserved Plasmodium protein, unknown function [Plasmodium gallinaceum]|uniref:Uncharacterized protein n=1 Tax=Plasmodium gallinaceum TaxID=5849 RepID=A0A1J1GRT6_PLAGA|nr:conserved Plasmodium protein, unknown function [Plasmodium gallinaceum]CRG95012.1 conserved Plasmodium protein, unknown function [Plasmodium gallinaceum]